MHIDELKGYDIVCNRNIVKCAQRFEIDSKFYSTL